MAWVRENSFETNFSCHGEVVTVRATRAGTLEMDGYDLQYDQAQMEFYGEITSCMDMYRSWDSLPASVIIKYFSMPYFTLCRLALDWAEHTSWMIASKNARYARGDAQRHVRETFDMIRKFIDIEEELINCRQTELRFSQHEREREISARGQSNYVPIPTQAATFAAAAVSELPIIATTTRQKRHDMLDNTYNIIQKESKMIVTYTIKAAELNRRGGGNREKTWQVRRFIDVMSAMKHNQPWPPLKWTK